MNWEEWVTWKNRDLIAVIFFIIAYILTIQIRDYSFLESSFDISNGIPIIAHIALIVIGAIVLIILLKIITIIIKYFLKK